MQLLDEQNAFYVTTNKISIWLYVKDNVLKYCFIQFSKYLFTKYCLDIGDRAVNKMDKNPCPHRFYSLVRKGENNPNKKVNFKVCQMMICAMEKNKTEKETESVGGEQTG